MPLSIILAPAELPGYFAHKQLLFHFCGVHMQLV